MTDEPLFDAGPAIVPEPAHDPLAGLSAGRRLTLRNARELALGRHPATGGHLRLPPLAAESCGTCHHLRRYNGRHSVFIKCHKHRLGESNSAASDVRVGWPACTAWAPPTEDRP